MTLTAAAAGTALILSACGDDDAPTLADAVSTYANGVYAQYEASHGSAAAMDGAVDAFIAAPSDETFAAAQHGLARCQ